MKIGDEVYVHGYVDEIRKDVIIIRNDGGYFGTVPSEVFCYEEDRNGYGTMNSAETPQTDIVFYDYDPNTDDVRHLGWNGIKTDCGWK